MKRLVIILTAILAFLAAVAAAAATRTYDPQPEDSFSLTVLENLAVAPDGSAAAYTENRWGEGKKGRSSDLWVVATAGGGAQRRRIQRAEEQIQPPRLSRPCDVQRPAGAVGLQLVELTLAEQPTLQRCELPRLLDGLVEEEGRKPSNIRRLDQGPALIRCRLERANLQPRKKLG